MADASPVKRGKSPRLRFTVRRLMVTVAIVAVAMGSLAYVVRLARLRAYYHRRAVECSSAAAMFRSPAYRDDVEDPVAADRLDRLADKYERAAARPWLPVEPDPRGP
jgi:hypothetical protein